MTVAPHEISATAAMNVLDARMTSHRHVYHELQDHPVIVSDVLEQLKSNLNQLEDLHRRLKFMMGEVTYLCRKSTRP